MLSRGPDPNPVIRISGQYVKELDRGIFVPERLAFSSSSRSHLLLVDVSPNLQADLCPDYSP